MSADNDNNKLYTATDIQRYLAGDMPPADMHILEKAALHDPFLAEAIEGYSNAKKDAVEEAVHLHSQLHNRIKSRVFYKPAGFTWWKVAAVFLIIAGMGGVIYSIVDQSNPGKTIIVKNEVSTQGAEQGSVPADAMIADSPAPVSIDNTRQKDAVSRGQATDSKRTVYAQPQSIPEGNSAGSFKAASSSEDMAATLKTEKDGDTLPVASPMMTQPRKAGTESRSITVSRTPQLNNFRGQVITRHNIPVAGATLSVEYRNNEIGVETDSNGYFNFAIPDTAARVQVSLQGYETANAMLRSNLIANTIQLAPQEETAKGKSAERKKELPAAPVDTNMQGAQPVTGWLSFEKYIETNKKANLSQNELHGDVVLSFTVGRNGRPTGFVVKKSLSKLADQEAVRLVKEGPGWKLLQGRPALVTISIRF